MGKKNRSGIPRSFRNPEPEPPLVGDSLMERFHCLVGRKKAITIPLTVRFLRDEAARVTGRPTHKQVSDYMDFMVYYADHYGEMTLVKALDRCPQIQNTFAHCVSAAVQPMKESKLPQKLRFQLINLANYIFGLPNPRNLSLRIAPDYKEEAHYIPIETDPERQASAYYVIRDSAYQLAGARGALLVIQDTEAPRTFICCGFFSEGNGISVIPVSDLQKFYQPRERITLHYEEPDLDLNRIPDMDVPLPWI